MSVNKVKMRFGHGFFIFAGCIALAIALMTISFQSIKSEVMNRCIHVELDGVLSCQQL